MTANVNVQANGQSVHPSQPTAATNGATHAPSVPISLYREVANDLQTARTTLQSLKTQNQELTQKNQQLRLEIERVVQSALHLRQVADSSWGMPNFPEATPIPTSAPLAPPANSIPMAAPFDSASSNVATLKESAPLRAPSEQPKKLHTEQPLQPLQPQAEPSTDISTWWLILIVCFIVVSAFGTGFLIVRPLLPSR